MNYITYLKDGGNSEQKEKKELLPSKSKEPTNIILPESDSEIKYVGTFPVIEELLKTFYKSTKYENPEHKKNPITGREESTANLRINNFADRLDSYFGIKRSNHR